MSSRSAPQLEALLANLPKSAGKKPIAFVLSGHNGSGKSTLWKERLAPVLERPLINADRLISSILPEADSDGHLVSVHFQSVTSELSIGTLYRSCCSEEPRFLSTRK